MELPDRLPEYLPSTTDAADEAASLLSRTWHTAAEFETDPVKIAHRVMDELGLFDVLERRLFEGSLGEDQGSPI